MEHLERQNSVAGREWVPREVKRLWTVDAKPCTSHAYLARHGIDQPGVVGIVGGTLLIPMRTVRQPYVNLQLISPDGRIDYLPGAEVKGTYCTFGSKSALRRTNTVYICEGWANGWTIHDATNSVVCAVFFRSELLAVATEIRRVHPAVRIIVCAVNDRWSYAEREGQVLPNAGVVAAFEASEKVGGWLTIPDFQDPDGRPTDFNDLRQREGRDSVIRWLDPSQVAYAKDRLEGHDVLEAACRARFPTPDTCGQGVRVGEALCRVVNGFADTTQSGSRAFLEASRLLRSAGLMVVADSLLVSNQAGWLHKQLEDRWPDRRWKSLLRELPDARPTSPKYFVDGLTSRATSVPLNLLNILGGL